MIIETRQQFDLMLSLLDNEDTIVYDTETNDLDWTVGNIIGMSLYLPKADRSFYLAFRHGEGSLKPEFDGYTFQHYNSWGVADKKAMFTSFWWDRHPRNYANLPIEWLDELKPYWLTDRTFIAHNAKFDVHMLVNEGFAVPKNNMDTLIMLHTLQEGLTISGHRPNVRIELPDGTVKDGYNFSLKPVCYWLGIPEAMEGEESLDSAIADLHDSILTTIANTHVTLIGTPDDVLDGIRTKKGLLTEARLKRVSNYIVLDKKSNMWMLAPHAVARYAELDVILTWKLYSRLLPALKAWDNIKLAEDWSNVTTKWLHTLERNGILLDTDYAHAMRSDLLAQIKDIDDLFPINLNSPAQKLEYLNEELRKDWTDKVPDWFDGVIKHYPDAVITSTNKQSLSQYSEHPAVQLLWLHNTLTNSVSKYLDKWLESATGSVHGNYKGHGTVSGRLASGASEVEGKSDASRINLQNIPSRGYNVKRVFVAPTDWFIFEIDYSSVESRLCAYVAEVQLGFGNLEKTRLIEAGEDIHSYTAEKLDVHGMMFGGRPLLELAKEHNFPADEKYAYKKLIRQMGKTANFALLYGGSGYTLAGMAGLDVFGKDADQLDLYQELAERWHEIFPAFREANNYYKTLARTNRNRPDGTAGYFYVTQPITNRHRHFNLYPNEWVYNNTLGRAINPFDRVTKDAMNNVVQGLGGYLTAMSGYKFLEKYGNDDVRMVATTHDSITGYCKIGSEHMIGKLAEIMCDWDVRPKLEVGLEVSYTSWQELKEVELCSFSAQV